MVPDQILNWTSRGFITEPSQPWAGTKSTSLPHSSSVCRVLVVMMRFTSPVRKWGARGAFYGLTAHPRVRKVPGASHRRARWVAEWGRGSEERSLFP